MNYYGTSRTHKRTPPFKWQPPLNEFIPKKKKNTPLNEKFAKKIISNEDII